jgi:hypothetical protein
VSLSARGTWDLKIDPTASYLVREATFTHQQQKNPAFAVSNSGLHVNGSCCFPAKARWTAQADRKDLTCDIEFTAGRFGVNEAILRTAADATKEQEPYPPNTLIWDFRTNPPSATRSDENGKLPVPKEIDQSSPSAVSLRKNFWFLAFFAINIGLLLALTYYWLHRRGRGGS